ncbi:major facilitator superfamily domain-containing protein [Favolaschia claudopus]|uniref:Major facilitator superfamily domain-containing protein n=1 Tax=Favolaschia claudopus TaxID=2862362 RepID=A0AAW0B2V9_9AGAR
MSLNKACAVDSGARSKTATFPQTITGCQQSAKSNSEKENPSIGAQDHANAPPQEEENYPRVALDNTIISTAIPKITDAFNSLQDVGWYGSAYLLTTAGTQLLFGKLYTHFSIKWVYVASIALFEIGTLLCGAAPSSSIFILGRAVAGVGNAGIFSGALVIIANSVPLAKRPLYTGMIGGMGGIGCVTGPIIGGIITDKLSFRYCFYLSLPLGGIALSLVIFLLKIQHSNTRIVTTTNFFQRLLNFDPFGTCGSGISSFSSSQTPLLIMAPESQLDEIVYFLVCVRSTDFVSRPPPFSSSQERALRVSTARRRTASRRRCRLRWCCFRGAKAVWASAASKAVAGATPSMLELRVEGPYRRLTSVLPPPARQQHPRAVLASFPYRARIDGFSRTVICVDR